MNSIFSKTSGDSVFAKRRQVAIHILLFVVIMVVAWKLVISIFQIPEYLIPSPESVVQSMINLPFFYWRHAKITLLEALLGLSLGVATGFLCGIVIRYSGSFGRFIETVVLASQVFPKEALAPLFLVLFGFGIIPKVLISTMLAFFPVAINTLHGLRSTPNSYECLFVSIGATRWQTFIRCDLHVAMTFVLASLPMAAALSVVGAVVGEFVGSSLGLGHVIRAANSDLGTDRIFAALLLLGLIGALLQLLVKIIEMLFRRWLNIRPAKSIGS